MPTNKNASIRYQALDRCFQNRNKRFFIEDLIDACNEALYEFNGLRKGTGERSSVKRRQIFDDIRYMESKAGWQIPLERKREGKRIYYRYKDPNFSIKMQPLTKREAEQLNATIQAISRYRDLPSYGWVEEIIANLENRFDIKDKKTNVVGFEKNDRLKGIWNLTKILDATSSRIVLKVKYRSYNEHSQEQNIIFHPYYVRQYNNRWFVFGLREDKNRISNLALDRIIDFEKLEDVPYHRNREIDFEHYFDDIVGVTHPNGVEKEHIVLKATKNRFPHIVSKPIIQGYLYWSLYSDLLKKFNSYTSTGTTILHLYQNVFENMPLVVPSKSEQEEISDYLDRKTKVIDASISKAQHQVELLQDYKQSLITEVVTGKRKVFK